MNNSFKNISIESKEIGEYKINQELIELTNKILKSDKNIAIKDNNEKHFKVIFLDVDGVLNCKTTKDSCCGYIGIDDKKVKYLKEIVDATDAIIVLVSSWKKWWTNIPSRKNKQYEMASYLDRKLFKQGLIICDKTLDHNSFYRGQCIIDFIEIRKFYDIFIDRFIILDDEYFDYKETKLIKHLVHTSFNKGGLTKKHVKKAIELLNETD